jgi:hypothetical protein
MLRAMAKTKSAEFFFFFFSLSQKSLATGDMFFLGTAKRLLRHQKAVQSGFPGLLLPARSIIRIVKERVSQEHNSACECPGCASN